MKGLALIAFSVLLLIPAGAQNAFAGVCLTGQTPLDVLLGGECIIAGDKQFDNWILQSQEGSYDLTQVQVIPVNTDPNNPGLRFLTPGFDSTTVDVFTGDSKILLEYDVTSLSSDLIKDFSVELIDATGTVFIEKFLDPCCVDRVDVKLPNPLFDEIQFTPAQSIGVSLGAALSLNPTSELNEFEVLYSQISTQAVGGEFIGIDTVSVLVAGTHSVAAWMIPVLVSAIGIAIVIARKF